MYRSPSVMPTDSSCSTLSGSTALASTSSGSHDKSPHPESINRNRDCGDDEQRSGAHLSPPERVKATPPQDKRRKTRDRVPPAREYIDPQPDTKPMPAGQLEREIKAIYMSLVEKERKCIEAVCGERAKMKYPSKGRACPDWPMLILLHEELLKDFHDFLLASQHPASSLQLQNLAYNHRILPRLWKHGIHSFLELLRHSLPESLEFMHEFFVFAYQMMALLYETVNVFQDIWTECLGDLARYRMAIEDKCPRDREIFTVVSEAWYSITSSRFVNLGRLYHHQAILARTDLLLQLSLYARSLGAFVPFGPAQQSIMTIFEPILAGLYPSASYTSSSSIHFIKLQAIRFTGRNAKEEYPPTLDLFLRQLDDSILLAGRRWKVIGERMAITLVTGLLMWGRPQWPLRKLFAREAMDAARIWDSLGYHTRVSRDCTARLQPEWHLLVSILVITLKRRDENCFPFLHVVLAFVWELSSVPFGYLYLIGNFPFGDLGEFLNHIMVQKALKRGKADAEQLPVLHENRVMQGQAFAQKLFLPTPMPVAPVQNKFEEFEELVHSEQEGTVKLRMRHLIELGIGIAQAQVSDREWLSFSSSSGFGVRKR